MDEDRIKLELIEAAIVVEYAVIKGTMYGSKAHSMAVARSAALADAAEELRETLKQRYAA